MLGEILFPSLRDKIYLCSKAGRNTLTDFDFTPDAMERSVEASLKRLQTDYLDVLIAHDIEFATDFEAVFTETAQVLHKLKKAGKCRFVGMSGLPLGILRTAIERCNLDVVISYTHYTLQSQRLLTELLPTAEKHGVGVINASPLCMGLISDAGAGMASGAGGSQVRRPSRTNCVVFAAPASRHLECSSASWKNASQRR